MEKYEMDFIPKIPISRERLVICKYECMIKRQAERFS